MDELHERMLEDLYTLIGFENAGRKLLPTGSAGKVSAPQRPRSAFRACPTTANP